MLKELSLKLVGPASRLEIEFSERLNIITGDNGLGKTFLLDMAWWALTGTWAANPARPFPDAGQQAALGYSLLGWKKPWQSKYDFKQQNWSPGKIQPNSGLVIYMQVDDGFSVWDSFRSSVPPGGQAQPGPMEGQSGWPLAFHFTPTTLWDGLREGGRVLCNGLIDDWVRWQYLPNQQETDPFPLLKQVITRLSPHPSEWMNPGKPTRVSIQDVRDIPTLDLPYGNVPVTDISAGMKRIISLAYLLIWTWYEHTQAARLRGQTPTTHLVLLIDEVESHLHPRWQRSILPAVLQLGQILQPKLKTQLIVTTHAPLVLASLEPHFKESRDRLFLLGLENRRVTLTELPWAKQGDTVGWLTSAVFGLKQARSPEAEQAIEAAEALMRGEDMSDYPPHLRTAQQINHALRNLLAGHDLFWPRWLVKMDLLPK